MQLNPQMTDAIGVIGSPRFLAGILSGRTRPLALTFCALLWLGSQNITEQRIAKDSRTTNLTLLIDARSQD